MRKLAPVTALILTAIVLAPGCNNGVKQVQQDLAGLRSRVDRLARSTSSFRARVENLENRMLLIQDEVETQKVSAMRIGKQPATPAQLPTVTLTPESENRTSTIGAPDFDTGEFLSGSENGDSSVYQQLDDEGRIVSGAGSKVRPKKQPQKAHKPQRRRDSSASADPLREYRSAYETYQQGRIMEAIEMFRSFVADHPRHPHADNAQYWIGECLYDQRDFEGARNEFMRVVTEHPNGNKVPDAMVKVGLCGKNLGHYDEARRMFNTVMLTYPDSEAAAVAMKLTGELQ